MSKSCIALAVLLAAVAVTAEASHHRKALGWEFPWQQKNYTATASPACPPPGFNSVKNFDLARYISAPFFVQKQVPIIYQPANQLYCVRAEYDPLDPSNPLAGVLVKNYANVGRVNGPPVGTSGSGGTGSLPGRFIATVPDPSDPSKLSVGFALPGATTPSMGAPYWVVAVGSEYQWAIITGGPPTAQSANGCTTSGPMGSSGFWLFSRKPVDPENTLLMEAEARRLGLDTSVLLPVAQEGCLYEGA